MVEISDEDAKKIGEAVRLSRISKVWKDPKKTETIVGYLVLGLAISIMINVFVFAIISDPSSGFGHQTDKEITTMMLKHMDCKQLSDLMIESIDSSYTFRGLVLTYQQAVCLSP